MITAKVGNLLESIEIEGLDGIINAANGVGPMGAGIAGAIRKHGGKVIQDNAFSVCQKLDPQPGQAYSTISGSLPIKRVIHAVTMKNPGGDTSLDIVTNAFISALELARNEGITKIGCTAFGTGIGGLDPIEVARRMVKVALDYEDDIDIIFVDRKEVFILEVRRLLAISYAFNYGQIDGNHHKTWVIDQMVRFLTGEEYENFVKKYKNGDAGPNTYQWNEGITP